MITHYDMMTGEIIEDIAQGPHPSDTVPTTGCAALRLLTVEEASALQPAHPRVPCGIAALPVDRLHKGLT